MKTTMKTAELDRQIAELYLIKHVALGTMNTVTAVHDLTRQYVIDVEAKIVSLQHQLRNERYMA